MRMFILGSGEYEIGNLAFASKIINFLLLTVGYFFYENRFVGNLFSQTT